MDKVINILMIEDDTLDVMDARRTLDRMSILYKMEVARNGEDALAMLERAATTAISIARPDIILLDLNMPKMNGTEFLQVLRSTAQWKDVKVFIITTSEEKEDRERIGGLGVSGYIVKPLKFNNPSSIDSFNLMIDLMNIKNGIWCPPSPPYESWNWPCAANKWSIALYGGEKLFYCHLMNGKYLG